MKCPLVMMTGKRPLPEDNSPAEVSNAADSLTSHQYKSYMVLLLHRIRGSTEVQLGMCVCVCVCVCVWEGGGGRGD